MLQCVATNEAGSESIATWLKVKSMFLSIEYMFNIECNKY